MTIEQFAAEGRMLLSESDISDAHHEFNEWVSDVAVWLDQEFPGTGRAAEWGSLGSSLLVVGGITNSYDTSRWIHFYEVVERRLSLLGLEYTSHPRP